VSRRGARTGAATADGGIRAGVDSRALLADLRKQVTALEKDLRARATSTGDEGAQFATQLNAEWVRAKEAGRTAANYTEWLDERVSQAAAAWVLSCVFVRFAEDNGLIEWPFLAGPGERFADAVQRREDFFRANPQLNDRDWLIAAFDEVAEQSSAAAGLFNRAHNPLWTLTPSFEAATALLAFWRRRGPDGEIVHSFADEDWDTRFLGDLYQDLSEHARKTYALLQTPVFVEEFILDLTLEPALEEFGIDGLRAIDPACGSGHFLLGMFHRLLATWQEAEPGTQRAELIRRALGSVHGCDKNPFAVAIARFRLHLAALRAAGATKLADDHGFTPQIAVGDSLWHGASGGRQEQLALVMDDERGDDNGKEDERPFTYGFEDVYDYPDLLAKNSYHVVVANPPYITVKDKAESTAYRKAFADVCAGTYALSVPFAALLFELALHGGGERRGAGFVGQITSNSFMKREFGKKLIEDFFANKVELTHIIDTSGAYIPGHGTPTVILVGRNQIADAEKPIRAVLGVRGEPGAPDVPAMGLVWTAIAEQVGKPGSESEWISVEDATRGRFATHPWSVGGGGAGSLQEALQSVPVRLSKLVTEIGFGGVTREDSAYMVGDGPLRRGRINESLRRPLVEGDVLRDWKITDPVMSAWPYDAATLAAQSDPLTEKFLWPHRAILRERVAYGDTQIERGLTWFEYSMFFAKRYRTPLSIAFAFVATHNHFVLDRGGKVFNRTAPVIKLPEGTSEDDHLALLGVLNSSTACFWLKQVCHDKGSQSGTGGFMHDEWERFFEFTGTKLQEFPLPDDLPLAFGRELDLLAQQLATQEPSGVCEAVVPTREALDAARSAWQSIGAHMIAIQDELDWTVYGSYNLLSAKELAATTAPKIDDLPELSLGERAFEIALARKVAAGEAETVWFARHNSTPITELPSHWPGWYRAIVESRIDLIESRKDLALIERPECKRRWAVASWEKRETEAVRTWLLDRTENPDLWYALREGFRQPRTLTVNQLADRLRPDKDVVSVAALYARDHLGKPDLPLERVLEQILATEHVPYLAALRYKESGLRKRAEWEAVWEKQREEDHTDKLLDIDIPPRYTQVDFAKTSYWSHRGKLDVPKERFIGYPGASPDADPSILLGWAGWDHKDQGQALVNLVNDRASHAAWTGERIAPLLNGLDEIMPWLRQWHGAYDAEWEGVPADDFSAFLTEQRGKFGVAQ
jgi:hypothetical protein